MSAAPPLSISTSTWDRKSDGLFDYHTHKVAQRSFRLIGSTRILRRGDDCIVTAPTVKVAGECESLLVVTETQGQYFVQSEEEAWMVAGKGSAKWPGLHIHPGDTIRFGRTAYKVVSLSTRKQSNPAIDATMISEGVDLDAEAPNGKSPGSCRICLSEEEAPDNMLLSPCSCDGSVKYIHWRCLQEWMRSKCEVKSKGCIARYVLNQLQCELCKTVLPEKVYAKGRNIELNAFTHPEDPHIILEESTLVPDTNARTLYILSFPEGRLMRVGRGRECDIRIRDFAVSRVNSFIRLQSDRFVLEDKDSKFGSLLQLTHPTPLLHLPARFQIDRTLVTIEEMRTGWVRAILCCCTGSGRGEERIERDSEDVFTTHQKRHRLDTRVVPFEVTETESYVNMPNCVHE